jgi:hypothetical protein
MINLRGMIIVNGNLRIIQAICVAVKNINHEKFKIFFRYYSVVMSWSCI